MVVKYVTPSVLNWDANTSLTNGTPSAVRNFVGKSYNTAHDLTNSFGTGAVIVVAGKTDRFSIEY